MLKEWHKNFTYSWQWQKAGMLSHICQETNLLVLAVIGMAFDYYWFCRIVWFPFLFFLYVRTYQNNNCLESHNFFFYLNIKKTLSKACWYLIYIFYKTFCQVHEIFAFKWCLYNDTSKKQGNIQFLRWIF